MMFLKPFMDSIISEPDEDPMNQYKINSQNKTLGKEIVSETENTTVNCDECGQT